MVATPWLSPKSSRRFGEGSAGIFTQGYCVCEEQGGTDCSVHAGCFGGAFNYHGNECESRERQNTCELQHKKVSQHPGTPGNTKRIPDPTQKIRSTKSWGCLAVTSCFLCHVFTPCIIHSDLSELLNNSFWFLMNFFPTPYLSFSVDWTYLCNANVSYTGQMLLSSDIIKYGLVQVDIWRSGLWFQITDITSTHNSENEQLGIQEPQPLVAWNFTCHLFFMRKHEKMFISVQIPCRNLRGKEEAVPVLKHLQSWNVCLKFLKKITMP